MGAFFLLAVVGAGFCLGMIVSRLLGRKPDADEPEPAADEPDRRPELSEVPAILTTMAANGLAVFLAWHACRSWATLQALKGARAEYRQGLADAKQLGAVAPVYPVGEDGGGYHET